MVLHERPWRFNALYEVREQIADADYWRLVREAWIDSENIWESEDHWIELLMADRPHPELIMEAEDRQALEQTPEILTVYRGYHLSGREVGVSWTLDEDRAVWFAKREVVSGLALLASGRVAKSEVIALFSERDESEIVVKPGTVEIIRIQEL